MIYILALASILTWFQADAYISPVEKCFWAINTDQYQPCVNAYALEEKDVDKIKQGHNGDNGDRDHILSLSPKELAEEVQTRK